MIWMIVIFLVGYLIITLEHTVHVNKAATALLVGVLCWTVYVLQVPDAELVSEQLAHHMSDIAGILFFLLGAMTIVEIIDIHDGFEVIVESYQDAEFAQAAVDHGPACFLLVRRAG